MAVPISNVTRRVVFAASGTGPYSFTFEILAETDVAVYEDDTLLTLTTDYTVTINANGTGSITLVSSPTGSQIAIVGDRAIERISDFVTGGDFFANTVNRELDSLTIFAQQNAESVDRALKAPQTDPTSVNMTLPRAADRANKYLAFDANGDPRPGDTAVEVTAIAGIATEIQAVAAIDTEIVAVDGIKANVTTVAGISSNVTTVAGIASNVTTVAGITSDISTVVTNIVAIQGASTAASDAASAKTAAEAARDATLAAYDSFDDRYLGVKTSDPTLDNDGNALVAGALYFNSSSEVMRLYTGSAWVAAYVSGSGYLAAANDLSDLADAGTARTNLGLVIGTDVQAYDATIVVDADIGVSVQAYDADTAKTDVTQSFTAAQRGAITALTDGATITPDFAVANNFSVTLGGNRTMANPSNLVAGQSGSIFIVQDGTGSRTLAWGSYWDFAAGTAPTLTTTAGAVDRVDYIVRTTGSIHAVFTGDYS